MWLFSRRARKAQAAHAVEVARETVREYEGRIARGLPVDDLDRGVQYPHCDSLVLHSPGTCEYCDRRPEWQEYRFNLGIAFSNDSEEKIRDFDLIPCPSTIRRPAEVRDLWYGNVPKPARVG